MAGSERIRVYTAQKGTKGLFASVCKRIARLLLTLVVPEGGHPATSLGQMTSHQAGSRGQRQGTAQLCSAKELSTQSESCMLPACLFPCRLRLPCHRLPLSAERRNRPPSRPPHSRAPRLCVASNELADLRPRSLTGHNFLHCMLVRGTWAETAEAHSGCRVQIRRASHQRSAEPPATPSKQLSHVPGQPGFQRGAYNTGRATAQGPCLRLAPPARSQHGLDQRGPLPRQRRLQLGRQLLAGCGPRPRHAKALQQVSINSIGRGWCCCSPSPRHCPAVYTLHCQSPARQAEQPPRRAPTLCQRRTVHCRPPY